MRKRCFAWFQNERGNAMLLAVLLSILIIMLTGGAIDMGLYYVDYRNAQQTVQLPGNEMVQMFPMYAYENDPQALFQTSADTYATSNGWDPAVLTTVSLRRTKTADNIRINTEVVLEDTYDCIFLPLLGINSLPIYARAIHGYAWNAGGELWSPGRAYRDWSPP